jgi:hypothetical protein
MFFLSSSSSPPPERAELESRVELLVTKEREWIEWNGAAEQMVARVAVIVDAWLSISSSALASATSNSDNQALGSENGSDSGSSGNGGVGLVELLDRCERAHAPLTKRLESAAAAVAAHRRLEDALRSSESSRSAHESSRDALLKQVQTQYDAAVRQLSKVQSDAREAFEVPYRLFSE